MLSKEQITQFHRDGFLNAGKIIADEQLCVLSTDLDTILEKGADKAKDGEPEPVYVSEIEAVGNEGPGMQIINIWEASTAFERVLYHPGIVEAVIQLSGFKDLQVWHDQIPQVCKDGIAVEPVDC